MADEFDAEQQAQEIQMGLSKAEPGWVTDGLGVRGPQVGGSRPTLEPRRSTDQPTGNVNREPLQPKFPEVIPEDEAIVDGALNLNASFLMKDASIVVNRKPVNRVLVQDGKINGVFPSGMGFGNYILTVDGALTTIIFAVLTFHPTTLLETSKYLVTWKAGDPLNIESRVESPTLGYLYYQIGFTYFTAAAKPQFTIWQTRLGDINFAFGYGVTNAARGLLPMDSGPGWLDTEAIA